MSDIVTAVTALIVAVTGLLVVLLAIWRQLRETHAMLNSRLDAYMATVSAAATSAERLLHPPIGEQPKE